ncbi:MAG: hypothetical protein IT443_13710 [Phycisphaeraceae bacterium]|nr:hypothetical protein [Phycisphaeraceae bacterium]
MNILSRISPRIYFYLALVCGLIPLSCGFGSLVLYTATRNDFWIQTGIATLCIIGPALLLVGLTTWGFGLWRLCRNMPRPRSRPTTPSAGVSILILLLNLPAGAICVNVGMFEATRYNVCIHNQTPQRIGPIRIYGGGCDQTIAAIQPHSKTLLNLWFKQDGELRMDYAIEERHQSCLIEGYVTSQWSGQTDVFITRDQIPSIISTPD